MTQERATAQIRKKETYVMGSQVLKEKTTPLSRRHFIVVLERNNICRLTGHCGTRIYAFARSYLNTLAPSFQNFVHLISGANKLAAIAGHHKDTALNF